MLTHVSCWENGHWQRITAADAFKKFHRSVSSNEGIFICDICNNYVSLAHGDVRDAFFKHSRGDEDKSCEERSQYYSEALDIRDYSLPLKIVRDKDLTWHFEVGIPPVPDDIYTSFNSKHFAISKDNVSLASWSIQRIQSSGYTFLYLDNTLSRSYKLSITDVNLKKALDWPDTIIGYSGSGRLFDADTGRMLALESDVYINKSYYYVTKNNLQGAKDIVLNRIAYLHGNLLLYEIRAEKATSATAFFFRRMGARLTTHPINVMTVWPPHYRVDDFVYCNSDYAYSLITGEDLNDINVMMDDCYIEPSAKPSQIASLYSIALRNDARNMLIGRNSALHNNKFIISKASRRSNKPEVYVFDVRHEKWDVEHYEDPPIKGKLLIETQYDANVYIDSDDTVPQFFSIKAEQIKEIGQITRGSTVSIYIGSELVKSIEIAKPRQTQSIKKDDDKLYYSLLNAKGKQVLFDHSKLAAISSHIQDERIKNWIRSVSLKGSICEEAYNLLKQSVKR